MLLNVVLCLIGVLFLIYGIRKKLTFWIVIGAALLGFSVISACVDYAVGGTGGIEGSRLPFVIDYFAK